MKVHTKIYLLLFFVLIVTSASAQKNFVVYHITGNVNIVTGNKSAAAKRGDILTKNNSFQLNQGADCMLIEEKGKSLQVSTSGNYTFEALQKMMLNTTNAGVTQKFFSYVYQNMFSANKEDNLSVTPVVFRGNELMKSPNENTIIISDAFTLGWRKPSGKMWVHLVVKDNNDKMILDTVLKTSTSLEINNIKNNFAAGNFYEWKAEESGRPKPSDKYFNFLIAEKNDRKKILNDLKLLQDKSISNDLKMQMQQDIFLKWKQYYSLKT